MCTASGLITTPAIRLSTARADRWSLTANRVFGRAPNTRAKSASETSEEK
ncbi:hypothetical protein CURTO8I2_210023 [Curtobacterium sp. 8I-2]|nr:hypothetical protein CURTO8I2_210023 [Curtobacterium sp. 8I-2]